MSTATGSDPSPPSSTGRPRDPRIDEAVLRATTELLEEVGYLQLTIGAIAARAGTNKPAIYRRWPTKALLVREAVFPTYATGIELGGEDLRGDLRTLVRAGIDILGRPAARAALPGLLAESSTDPSADRSMLDQFAGETWDWMQDRLDAAIGHGEVRPGVKSSTVLELIAGSTLIATTVRSPGELDADWVEGVVDIIVGGIAP